MALTVTHAKVSAIADDPASLAAGEVLPSDWNAGHTVTGTLPAASVTGLATVATSGSASDLGTGTLPDARLSNTITAGGPTGSATVVPVITYDAKGRLTAVTTASITQPAAANPSASVGLTAVNGSASTFMRSDAAPPLDQTAAYAFSGLGTATIVKAGIGAVSTDGGVLTNTTAAAVGAQQWSPRLRLTGQGWKTTATAASQPVDWIIENQPQQGAASPGTFLIISSQINGAGYVSQVLLTSNAAYFNANGVNGTGTINAGVGNFASTVQIAADSGTLKLGASTDVIISRGGAAATLQLGAANAASPVAQNLQAQGSRPGTDSNVGGASVTFDSGKGTGIGTPSTAALRSPVAVASGVGVQTLVAGITANVGTAVLTSYTVATLPAAATAGAGATAFVTDANTTIILGLGLAVVGGGANKVPVYSDGTNWIIG